MIKVNSDTIQLEPTVYSIEEAITNTRIKLITGDTYEFSFRSMDKSITGVFKGFRFNDGGEIEKILIDNVSFYIQYLERLRQVTSAEKWKVAFK